MNGYKYKTIEEIQQLPKYKELSQLVDITIKNPSLKNKYDAQLYLLWYLDQLDECEEYMIKHTEWVNKEFVDVKDIALGDKVVYEVQQ